MTPIADFLARYLPRWLIVPALAVIYTGLMMSIVVLGDSGRTVIAYVDVGKR